MRQTSIWSMLLALVFAGCEARLPAPAHSPSPADPAHPPQPGGSELVKGGHRMEGGRTVEAPLFRIALPQGWELREDPLLALHAVPAGASLYPSLKVAVLQPAGGAGVEEVVRASRERYAQIWKLEQDDTTRIAGRPCRRLVLLQDVSGTVSRQVKYFVEAGSRVFIITGQSAPEDFDRHEPLFEAITESLEFTLPAP